MRSKAMRFMAGTTSALLFGGFAGADVAYVADRATYYVAPGGTANVHVFARFRGADALMLAGENGLYSIGVSLETISSSPLNTPALLASAGAAMLNLAEFDDSFGPLIDTPFSPRYGAILLTDPFGNDGDLGVVGTLLVSDRFVLIGTFVYTASMNIGEGSTIVVGDYDQQLSDTVTWQTFQVIDSEMSSTRFGIVVSANPACPADLDNDGQVTSQDFFDFLAGYFAGTANFNGLDDTNSQDFFDYLTAFFTGC